MSVKTKWPRADALAVAAELGDILTPFCERLEIAGVTMRNGTFTKATSERDVFHLCGCPYLEPQNR